MTLDAAAGIDLFRFAALAGRVSRMLDAKVDLAVEPARSARMQAKIDWGANGDPSGWNYPIARSSAFQLKRARTQLQIGRKRRRVEG